MVLKRNLPIYSAFVVVAAAAGGYGIWWYTRRRQLAFSQPGGRSPTINQIKGRTKRTNFDTRATVNKEWPMPRTTPLLPPLTRPLGPAPVGAVISAMPTPLIPTAPSPEPPTLSTLVPSPPTFRPRRADPEVARSRPAFSNRNRKMVVGSAIVIGAAMLCYGTLAHVQSTPKLVGTTESAATEAVGSSATEPQSPAEGPSGAVTQPAPGSDTQAPGPGESAEERTPPNDDNLKQPHRRSLHRHHTRRQRSMSQKTRAFLHKVF